MNIKRYMIKDTSETRLKDLDPDERGEFKSKEEAEAKMEKLKKRLAELQDILLHKRSIPCSLFFKEWIPAGRTEPLSIFSPVLTRKASSLPASRSPLWRRKLTISCGESI